jgi:hypothetical protein
VFERGFKSWCETVAAQRRRDLGLRSDAPLDPIQVAASLGVEVHTADEVPGLDRESRSVLSGDSDGWSAVTITDGVKHVIILNSAHSVGRSASDLMHELSHIIIGHSPGRVDITEDGSLILNTYDKAQEQQANWLAGCLLLPREALLWILREGLSREAAAQRYGVSVQMLEYRLNVTAVRLQIRRRRAGKFLVS